MTVGNDRYLYLTHEPWDCGRLCSFFLATIRVLGLVMFIPIDSGELSYEHHSVAFVRSQLRILIRSS